MLVELTEKELKTLKEALSEAYDAVTDRNNIKSDRQTSRSYLNSVMERLKSALKEKGINSKLSQTGRILSIGKCKVTLYNFEDEYRDINRYSDNTIGPESDDDAGYSQMENNVMLRFWDETHALRDKKTFDVRNTPGMVKWILDNIER